MPITHKWTGTVLTITSDSGTSSCDLKGDKGDDGARGAQGKAGGTCYNVSQAAYNYVDNSDFSAARFIAQAGFNSKHGNFLYMGDRWINDNNLTAEQQTNGIKITTTGQYQYIKQHITVKVGQTYTAAIKASTNTTNVALAAYPRSSLSTPYARVIGNSGIQVITFTPTEEVLQLLVYAGYSSNGGSAVIEWVALYEGEYTAATLPPYQYKGYAAELAECQRYYQIRSVNNIAAVDMRPVMRVNVPTIAAVTSGYEYVADL